MCSVPHTVTSVTYTRYCYTGSNENIEMLLGHSLPSVHARVHTTMTIAFGNIFQTDLLGQNILSYTHPEDHALLKQQLIPNNVDKLFEYPVENEDSEPRARTDDEEDEVDRRLKQDRRLFRIR